MNPKELIQSINASCKKSISSAFNLSLCNYKHNFIHFVLDGTSHAVNRQELVKVLHWFDHFWLFFEIQFKIENKKIEPQIYTFISLSVFQGEDSDDKKYQLFKTEWNDDNNPDKTHIHNMIDEQQIVKWLQETLFHVRKELEEL